MSNRGFIKNSEELARDFATQRPLRAGSLIVTVFGDVVAPRGGVVWLGSLINTLDCFGLNQRLIRTSVFRLAKDGWLASQSVGRRSYYGLTDTGRRRFETAAKRIYGPLVEGWDQHWMLVVTDGLPSDVRDTLRKELSWLGFGALCPGLLGHPTPDTQAMVEVLRDLKVEDQVMVLRGQKYEATSSQSMLRFVRRSWRLEELENRYQEFLQRFRPVYKACRGATTVDPEAAFRTRVLLLHEYRKIHLRDPLLPATLLPSDWAGQRAYQLCRNLYGLVYGAADDYVGEHFETADGPLPSPTGYFFRRFGGLRKT